MESEIANPTHTFRETNFVLQLIKESQIKSQTAMSWSSQRKRSAFFVTLFVYKNFLACVLSQYTLL